MRRNLIRIPGLGLMGLMLVLLLMQSCNRDPYMPNTTPPIIEIGSGDNTYGSNNDDQQLLASLKVMTFNIHTLSPPSKPGETDIAATAKVITDASPDVVFLQEVDKNSGRNGYTGDQAKDLAAITKMNFVFYSATSVGRGMYGVAILSKYPLRTIKKYMLTKESESTEQRVLGTAVIDLPGVDSLTLAATHLQHNSATNRLQQIKDITRLTGPVKGTVIIGGDLNEMESNAEFFNVFDAMFTRTCKGGNCPPTFSAQLPRSVIDYIAYKPSNAFSVQSHKVINEYYASDHLPVIAELNFTR
ncbi:MAG: endonuclease/exonuclease/phosphatase [Chitinophagaceae bacterium]|nr:MAG: endonuclease/exonuclease/phosphatase [Chitinophagaceae bacterium]